MPKFITRVERSLYQRAVGYHYDSVKIFMPAGAKKPIYAPYVEHVPPDTIAAIFWLKNRDPAYNKEVSGGKSLRHDDFRDRACQMRTPCGPAGEENR